jgi:FkbM family methyltransferase
VTGQRSRAADASLRRISERPIWRDAYVRSLIEFEKALPVEGEDVREIITGPLVDALYSHHEILRKTLSSGITFEFLYRSKIVRDFVMAHEERPNHVWEPQTTRTLVDLARCAASVVIGGAYFGDHAILVAHELSQRGGVVHAFEPDSDQRDMLGRNAELNDLTNIRVRPEGLWHDSSASLKLSGHDAYSSAEVALDSDAKAFQATTIDDYMHDRDETRLDLIMLDVEGGEFSALKGARSFLAAPLGEAPNIVFEIHRHYVDWSDGLLNTPVVRFLTKFGYQLYALRDFHSNYDLSDRPVELIPLDRIHLDGPPHGFNVVASKDRDRFSGPNYTIVPGVSPKYLRHADPRLHHPIGGL